MSKADGMWCNIKKWCDTPVLFHTFCCALCKTKVEREEPMKGLWRLHLHYIHSRCWLDLVEPGPVVLGAGFRCLFLQVWCLMLIPPHMLHGSYPNRLVTAPVGPPFLPPAFFSLSASPGGQPTHIAAAGSKSPLLFTCHQSCRPEWLSGTDLRSLYIHPRHVFFLVWTSLMQGYVHSAALLQAQGQAWAPQSWSVVMEGVLDLSYFKPGQL